MRTGGSKFMFAWRGSASSARPGPIRRRDRDYRPFFERDWPDYLTGAIHDPRQSNRQEQNAGSV